MSRRGMGGNQAGLRKRIASDAQADDLETKRSKLRRGRADRRKAREQGSEGTENSTTSTYQTKEASTEGKLTVRHGGVEMEI